MNNILLADIAWNPYGWRKPYINRKAGHRYARKHEPGESFNLKFNKPIDTGTFVYGFFQWTKKPINFEPGGLIIFYTKNTDTNKGQIVGVYGKAELVEKQQQGKYWSCIRARKDFSILFPVYLDADTYKSRSGNRLVGQCGFSYRDVAFAERILRDELAELPGAENDELVFRKLASIYETYAGKRYRHRYISGDEQEQQVLERLYQRTKSIEAIRDELRGLNVGEPEEVVIRGKTYKRDNRTIAQLKILGNFECQICGTSIAKRNGAKFVEAAHIDPKCDKGRETPDNILLLCPNHHKEFDLGARLVNARDKKHVDFTLNGRRYKVKFLCSVLRLIGTTAYQNRYPSPIKLEAGSTHLLYVKRKQLLCTEINCDEAHSRTAKRN